MRDLNQDRNSEPLFREKAYLNSLRRSLEMGSCDVLKAKITRYGPCLSATDDPAVRAEYQDILVMAEEAFRIEEAHGSGSLLNLDHRIVRALIERVPPEDPRAIPLEQIEAARRYSAAKAASI